MKTPIAYRFAELGIAAWQDAIGYVPQSVYLADASVSANIAFGVPEDRVDQWAVVRAAQAAQIADFVEANLPDGYATRVGERGVRLSGGQWQRIGIARALYHDPQVLVLDEGTSALDGLTEASVMDAIGALAHRKTILLVAHRLSTVSKCDQIFVMDRGRLRGAGTFDHLLSENEAFRSIALVQSDGEREGVIRFPGKTNDPIFGIDSRKPLRPCRLETPKGAPERWSCPGSL
jgi:ABC-type multidrug transport system fused ATPase/permease subunit